MKKFISALISSVMLFSGTVYGKNISSDFWAYNQVTEAYNDGWFNELDVNDYALKSTAEIALSSVFKDAYSKPETDTGEYITRGELAEELSEFLPRDASVLEISFSDTDLNKYNDSIQKCVNAGLLNGYADGTFKPDNPVTNAELAVVISNLKKNRAEALELYNRVDEKYKDLKSFTMDMASDMNMTMNVLDGGEVNVKTVSTGSIKTVINNLETFDIEMSGNIETSAGEGMSQKLNLYYKDNAYYMDMDNVKVKAEVDFNEVMSQLGLNYQDLNGLTESSFILGYVKKNDDGTKELYAEIDMDNLLRDGFMQNGLGGLDFQPGSLSTTMHIDGNDNIISYDVYYDMNMGDGNNYIGCEMAANYKLRDLNKTVVDVPENLDGYQDKANLVVENEGDGIEFFFDDETMPTEDLIIDAAAETEGLVIKPSSGYVASAGIIG